MAKPKKKVLVTLAKDHVLLVYAIDLSYAFNEISKIEGVSEVFMNTGHIMVFVSLIYDANEVAAEIESALTEDVPDVFKE